MVKKVVEPIIETAKNGELKTIGFRAEYSFFGLVFYRKLYYSPVKYNITDWYYISYMDNI